MFQPCKAVTESPVKTPSAKYTLKSVCLCVCVCVKRKITLIPELIIISTSYSFLGVI